MYGAGLALAATALQWLDYQHAIRFLATEFYIAAIALGFTALGLWAGSRLTRQTSRKEFVRNEPAIRALGISGRELEVLRLLEAGQSNKEIAANLFISPNTVKTHLARLYNKLDVSSRTQAANKARSLRLIEGR